MTGERNAESAWTTPLRTDLWKKHGNIVPSSLPKQATVRPPAIDQKDASSQHTVSQDTSPTTVPQNLAPPTPPNYPSFCSTITTSASIAQKSKSTSGYSLAQKSSSTTARPTYSADPKPSSTSSIPLQSSKRTLSSHSRIRRPQSHHRCPRPSVPTVKNRSPSSSTLSSAQPPPTTPPNDTTKKQPQLPQAHFHSPAVVNEWQEVRSRRTKSVTLPNRKPPTNLITSNSPNVAPNSPLVDNCIAVPINLHATDKIRVPRRTKEEELVEACKENLPPGTGHFVVSPSKSVNSDTHVEITSTLEEFKAGFKTQNEDIQRKIREEYTQALRESERRILDRLELFANLGVDILIRTLEDQVLDKMREYTKTSEDDTQAHRADIFHTTFASNLREQDIQQLRHSSRRNKANEIAHAASSVDGAKRRNEQLLQHLKKYGSTMEAETCQRFVDFLYDRITVIKRRH